MATLDLYYWQGTECDDGADASAVTPGMTLVLDGCDGFFDQYFERRDRGAGARFSLVVMDGSERSTEVDPAHLAARPRLDVTVLENHLTRAFVRVEDLGQLGAWVTSRPLDAADRLDRLPAARRPDEAVMARLHEQAGRSGTALWAAPREPGARRGSELLAVWVVRGGDGERVLLLRDFADGSDLVRVDG